MQVTDARAALSVVKGTFTVRADGDVEVYLDTREHTPLSACERHATLRIAGAGEGDDADDFTATVELDADVLEALAAALEDATATEDDRDTVTKAVAHDLAHQSDRDALDKSERTIGTYLNTLADTDRVEKETSPGEAAVYHLVDAN